MRCFSFVLLLTFCLAPSAGADSYTFHNISNSPAVSTNCTVATSPEGVVVVAWQEPDGIWTRAIRPDGVLAVPMLHGQGTEPTLCCNAEGFTLAFAADSAIVCRAGDGFTWGPPETLNPGAAGACRNPNLCPSPPPVETEVWMTWVEDPVTIWFARRVLGVWQIPEVVSTITLPTYFQPWPQVEFHWALEGAGPRAYYLDYITPEGPQISYCDRLSGPGGGWTSPAGILLDTYGPGPGVRMSVASDADARQHILTLGNPPVCPCNMIFCVSERTDSAGWGPSEDLTVYDPLYYWTLPCDPALAVDSEGSIVCFWSQTFRDVYFFFPMVTRQYFKIKRQGVTWEDHSAVFSGHGGNSHAVIIDRNGNPLFVWSEDGEIMLACVYPTVPVGLLSLEAARRGDEVIVTWQVADGSMDHIGFHLCRETPGHDRETLTQSPLSGRTRYEFVDRTAPAEAVEYWLGAVLRDGTMEWHGPLSVGPAEDADRPFVARSSPNPFFSGTKIRFTHSGEGFVELSVFDLSGRVIARPFAGVIPAGVREISWDGRDSQGRSVVPGVYVYAIETASGRVSGKMVKTEAFR